MTPVPLPKLRPTPPGQALRRPIRALALACMLGAGASAGAQDLAAGKAIATAGAGAVPACSSCHGAAGEGNAAAGFPRLAGLGAAYLAKQLDEMADGARPSPAMQATAAGLTPARRRDVAAYFAGLPAPYPESSLRPPAADAVSPADRGAWLAVRGDWPNGLPACNQCHGPGGTGVGEDFPALAGQPQAYLAAQLHAWREGRRPPLPLGLMPAVASRLSDADIQAVADYYARLPQAAPSAPAPSR